METTLRENIYWVGHVDWNVRDFHGYVTERGTTYNAYLIEDKKTAIIDTVKAPFADEMLRRTAQLTDLGKIAYIVCNHAETDHAGALPVILRACPQAELVCNTRCRDTLARHFSLEGVKLRVVAEGQTLSLGRHTLQFIETPMVHWPESMFTYVPEAKLIFTQDAFGQHYASAGRFEDQEPADVVMAEAKTYYANILMLYGRPIKRAMDKVAGLDIEMIAPTHGVIWRRDPGVILAAYRDWVVCKPRPKVLVMYDTMWKSTERMAEAMVEGASIPGVEVKLIFVRASTITIVATESLDAATIAFGSSTLNQTLMPGAAQALTYLKGLKPAGKAGFAFGSYGWTKDGAKDVEEYLKAMKFDILREPLHVLWSPDEADLEECRRAGRLLADKALEMARAAAAQS